MSIPQSKYVSNTSALGGNANVALVELITRMMSVSIYTPPDAILEFTNAADVGAYYGTVSEEYLRAQFYFSWISKNNLSPQKMSFGKYANSNTAPGVRGQPLANLSPVTTLATLQAITNGSLKLTFGSTTHTITSLNFSAIATFSDAATLLQTAIRGQTGGTQWSAAVVNYDATNGDFFLSGGDASTPDKISIGIPSSGTNIAPAFGFFANGQLYPNGPTFTNGVLQQTVVEAMQATVALSNNFGSFIFTTLALLSQDQIVQLTEWNETNGVQFAFLCPVTSSNYSAISTALSSLFGTALTLSPLASEFPEMIPGMIAAATDYSRVNSVQNYMFQQFSVTPSVTDGTTSNTLDAAAVNYYGQTQSAGQQLSFYQPGILTGASVSTNITDMSSYFNECWLKNAVTQALLSLLIALPEIPANAQGVAQILTVLQSVINQALLNGTISVNGFLNTTQKLYITNITNDPKAWYQVQSIGYWIDCVIEPYTVGMQTFYKAVYTLVYKKNDVVRKIEGSHDLN